MSLYISLIYIYIYIYIYILIILKCITEKCINRKIKINDCVQCIAQNEAFITIKDHKPNFPENVTCGLLNPCKSEISKVRKVYLENVNDSVRSSSNFKNCYWLV